jgi:hypothetical protein
VNGFTRIDVKGLLLEVPANVLDLPPKLNTYTWGMLRSYVREEAHLSNHQEMKVGDENDLLFAMDGEFEGELHVNMVDNEMVSEVVTWCACLKFTIRSN